MKIIAVDPGKMCGLFIFVTTTGIVCWDELPPYGLITEVNRQMLISRNISQPVAVVSERYTFTSVKMTPQYDAIETNGALRYITTRWGVRFTLQSRAEKTKVTNEILKRVGWYSATPDGHANDAARHALLSVTRLFPDHEVVRRAIGIV